MGLDYRGRYGTSTHHFFRFGKYFHYALSNCKSNLMCIDEETEELAPVKMRSIRHQAINSKGYPEDGAKIISCIDAKSWKDTTKKRHQWSWR